MGSCRHESPVNADLPWWSIIEAMRAAIGCIPFTSDAFEQRLLLDAYGSCFNALFLHYVSEKSGFCIQARDEKGDISDTIPAVPDADPNYHTGLPLIFCLENPLHVNERLVVGRGRIE